MWITLTLINGFKFLMALISLPAQPLHSGAAVKLDQKWPTLTNNFSMDFDHRVPKFGIQLPQLPNFPNKYKCRTLIFEK